MLVMSPRDQSEDINSDNSNNERASNPQPYHDHIEVSFGEQQQPTSSSAHISDHQLAHDSPLDSPLNSKLASNRRHLMKNQIFGYDMPFDVISVAYATAVAVGGIMGYVKAKSIYSLAAGLAFGGVLGFGAYQTSVNPRDYYLTLGTSAVLGSFMGYRAYHSGKFMPAGLVATLSILMVLRFTIRAINDYNYVKK